VLGKIQRDNTGFVDNKAVSLAYSPNGRYLAVGREARVRGKWGTYGSSRVELWNKSTNTLQKVIYVPRRLSTQSEHRYTIGTPLQIQFASNSQSLLVQGVSGIAVVHLQTGKSSHMWRGSIPPSDKEQEFGYVKYQAVGFTQDSRKVLFTQQWRAREYYSSQNEESIKRDQLQHQIVLLTCDTLSGKILSRIKLDFHKGEWPRKWALIDDKTLLCTSASSDDQLSGEILTFGTAYGQRMPVMKSEFGRVNDSAAFAVSPATKLLAANFGDELGFSKKRRKDGVYNFDSQRIGLGPISRNMHWFSFDETGNYLAGVDSKNNKLIIWNLITRNQQHLYDDPYGSGRIAFAPGSRTLATISRDGNVRLWRLR
jgi:WD40 repeat protein